MHKKKILFLSNHFITLYSFRKELLRRLAAEGHDIYVSTTKDEQNTFFTDLGIRVIETPIDRRGVNPVKDVKTLMAYLRIIKDVKPDIIFSYTIKPNIYGTMASNILGYKQVCNITGTGATFLNRNMLSRVAEWLYKLSIKKCYKVFFQNIGDRNYFVKHGMVNGNYDLLPGSGVNLEMYHVTEFPSDEEIVFLMIGRVMKLKGIDEYLAAAEKIRAKHANTKFYIVGWNEEPEYIEKVKDYESRGVVEYLGFRKDVPELIKKAQCTILPSHGGEGVPNVLLESAASGRVCIASDINGSKDVIEFGRTGYTFEVGSADSLAEKIETFLSLSNAERRDMGLSGRKKMEREFDRNIVVNRYLNEVELA